MTVQPSRAVSGIGGGEVGEVSGDGENNERTNRRHALTLGTTTRAGAGAVEEFLAIVQLCGGVFQVAEVRCVLVTRRPDAVARLLLKPPELGEKKLSLSLGLGQQLSLRRTLLVLLGAHSSPTFPRVAVRVLVLSGKKGDIAEEGEKRWKNEKKDGGKKKKKGKCFFLFAFSRKGRLRRFSRLYHFAPHTERQEVRSQLPPAHRSFLRRVRLPLSAPRMPVCCHKP